MVTHCHPCPPVGLGPVGSLGFPADKVLGDPGKIDGVALSSWGPVVPVGPHSLSPDGQLGARLWEMTPPLLCSWGMSLTVAPSGTWRGGGQRLGSFPCQAQGGGLPPQTPPAGHLVVVQGVESLPAVLSHRRHVLL